MRIHYNLFVLLAVIGIVLPLGLSAEKGPGYDRPRQQTDQTISFRSECENAVRQYDMQINNVRARLTTGGDIWYDGTNGRYIVPKPAAGQTEVSSIYAGAVWLGGVDPGGNLKVAAQDFGRNNGSFDFYPGPLTPDGSVQKDTCSRWDKFFTVLGDDIRDFLAVYEEAREADNLPLSPEQIPLSILGWPALGNPYFADIHGFELPDADQGLAGFWDEDFSGGFDPTLGDYPIIEVRGCSENPQFPDEMTFYVYNDAGNIHRQSGTPNLIQMEIQVQAFAYTSSDDFNNMTFQRYKLINRAQEDILNTYFAMWMDPDLGCSTDDYVGSDTVRSLAYVYNEDELDGAAGTGCTCGVGVATYCDEVPILGVDYFRGPRGEDDVELGMSSFMYYNRAGADAGNPPVATTDPNTAEEYYNYLRGLWRDGSPLYACGTGFDQGCGTTRYAFPSAPNDESDGAWSMAEEGLNFGDRRTIQASGPFTLKPGAVNELIIGVVWVPNQNYPRPSLRRLQTADDLAQSLFDNCFQKCDGPDAPDVDIVELDQEIILMLSNGRASNNFEEKYSEAGLGIPMGEDSLYRFEGYRIYQFAGPNVSLADIDDPERVRQVAQFDIQNGVTRLFNWTGIDEEVNPLDPENYFIPELQVIGNDAGLRHTVRLTLDAFASGGDTRLINHRRYYYTAVAYGYNNYKEFDPFDQEDPGQQTQYKSSSRNIGDDETGNNFYVVIPRPILDRELFAEYGEGAVITRVSGEGNNGNFLDLNEETVSSIEAAFTENSSTRFAELTYESGAGPIDVFVSNPRTIQDGEYELTFVDENMDNEMLDDTVTWELRSLTDNSLPVVISETPISRNNEQIVPEFGFSVRIADAAEPGSPAALAADNGAIGATLVYDDRDGDRWLSFLPDGLVLRTPFAGFDANIYNYVATDILESSAQLDDPELALTNLFPGVYPLQLIDYLPRPGGDLPYLGPGWITDRMGGAIRDMELSMLRNVDIVFTDDKSLWTRCPVLETSSRFFRSDFYEGQEIKQEYPLDPRHLDLRDAPSVTRNAGPDGLPEVDTTVDPDSEEGYGWFPGYAVDVETGERLQVFWGENSLYDGRSYGEYTAPTNGNDMIWNPSSLVYSPLPDGRPHVYNYVSGAQHYFYVMDRVYDEGDFAYGRFEPSDNINSTRKVRALREVIWAGFPLLTPGSSLKSYADGIIPNKATLKLRVNNSFGFAEGTPESNGYPTYRFKFEGKQANTTIDDSAANRAMDAINVVPNPYYGFSTYEDNQFESVVKITNLPALATVSIYTLDGKFIRKYNRDETPAMLRGANRPVGERQISPALEWDLKNQAGIPIASGIYLIHVDAPGLGERTLKFFGVQRQFDPSGL